MLLGYQSLFWYLIFWYKLILKSQFLKIYLPVMIIAIVHCIEYHEWPNYQSLLIWGWIILCNKSKIIGSSLSKILKNVILGIIKFDVLIFGYKLILKK